MAENSGNSSKKDGEYEWLRLIVASMAQNYPVTQTTPDIPSLAEVDNIPFFDHLRAWAFHYRSDKQPPEQQYLLIGARAEVTQKSFVLNR